uniref:Uncharacterized protein n=1 Tax=Anopheles merus TaxID=30066 RepID=A0A182UZ41_ANOME
MSAHIRRLRLPSDFKRRLRDLRYIEHWKASEHKMLLQVAGVAVLKDRLKPEMYDHFLLLFVAMTMLSTLYHRTLWGYADELLHQFEADYAQIYSQELVNSNVHSLLHVLEDVENFGDLGTISAYDFEARLHGIRQLVRTGRYSLAQAVNRIFELQRVEANRLKQL